MANLESSRVVRLIQVVIYFGCIVVVHAFTGPRNGLLATLGGLTQWPFTFLDAAIYLMAILATTALLARILSRMSLSDLGLSVRGVGNAAGGLALGLLLMSLIFLISLILGWIRVEQVGWPAQTLAEGLAALSAAVALQVAIAINEEVIFRGYILQRLAGSFSFGVAATVSSVVFALVHVLNPNASILTALAITVPGLLLAMLWRGSGSLWMPIGFHFGWNVSEGLIFGFPLSGVTGFSLLKTTIQGPDLFMGGSFGPEGGVLGIAASLAGFGLLWLGQRNRFLVSTGETPLTKGGARQP